MWETIAIIVTLGGLELVLWLLDRRAARRDHEMQRKQPEVLDGILTELAIQNTDDMDNTVSSKTPLEVTHEGAGTEAHRH